MMDMTLFHVGHIENMGDNHITRIAEDKVRDKFG